MAKILPFPGPGVRAEIHTMVSLYASGKWSMQRMMTAVAGRLDEYGINSLSIGNYTVRKIDPETDPETDPDPALLAIWPVVIIESETITVSDKPMCPVCKSEVRGYLFGDEDVTVTCLDCGCIYEFKEGADHEDHKDDGKDLVSGPHS